MIQLHPMESLVIESSGIRSDNLGGNIQKPSAFAIFIIRQSHAINQNNENQKKMRIPHKYSSIRVQ